MAFCLGVLSLSGCASTPPVQEPLNLSLAKAAVVAYVDNGSYERDLRAVAIRASEWLEQRAARRAAGERLAVVFDIDETVLSNYEHIKSQDFGYTPAVWNAWVASASAPAIAAIKAVYDRAREHDIAVIFITGRRELRDRIGTEQNLRREGMGDYVRLIMSVSGQSEAAAREKTAARAALERAGWTIIANIGDQESDLAGGHAEQTFKLPNPFYLTP